MLYPLDKNGSVVNEAGIDKIQAEYLPLLRDVLELNKSIFGARVFSFFVRGSVSVGRATHGLSDVDCVVFVDKPISSELRGKISLSADKARERYPFVTFIDVTVISLDELLRSHEYRRLKIYLKTQSFCYWGKDILGLLPAVYPGKELALEMYGGIGSELSELKKIFDGTDGTRTYLGQTMPIKFWCVWLSRTLLRGGLGLVMLKHPLYSQDLRTCFEVFSKAYPRHKKEMEMALKYSAEPSDDPAEVLRYFNKFVPKFIGLWDEALT